ncbi:MAG: cupredoxin domain-containing protein [Thermoanaerobaculia bacterium]
MKRIILFSTALLVVVPPIYAGTVNGNANCGSSCDSTVVYLEGLPAASGEGSSVVFDQKDKVFIPNVLPVQHGTTVEIKNGDPFLHNVHIYDTDEETVLNIALPFQGQVIPHEFEEPGTYRVRCDAHPEMSASIVVLESQSFGVVDSAGSFVIEDVPEGSFTLVRHDAETGEAVRKPVQVSADGSTEVDF